MNSAGQNRQPWAQLVFSHNVFANPIEIVDDRLLIGRAPGCGLSLRDNKNISALHCSIERDADGRFYLADFSGNGTFINVTERVGKGNRKEITDGCVIFLVKKKAAELAFTFKVIRNQPVVAQTPAPSAPAAIASIPRRVSTVDEVVSSVVDSLRAEKSEGPPAKKARSGSSNDSVVSKPAAAPSVATTSKQSIRGGTPVPLNRTATASSATPAAASEAGESSTRPKESAIADNLVCSICFDIIHDCISLQPCMHCFCAGCYSEWMERSNVCPDCRVEVRRINKNHVLNNVISAYLAEHPEKKRSDEELKSLDAKNKITLEMLKGKRKKNRQQAAANYHGSDCECSECDEDYSDSDESDDDGGPIGNPIGINPWPVPRYHQSQCRLCVGYQGFPVLNARARQIDPNARRCPPGQLHVLCQCCFANMPDRRNENNPALPPISCSVCQQVYCDMVFGCSRGGCVGCLGRFKDMTFPMGTYDLILNENAFETAILKNYMAKNRKTWNDVLKECTEKMDRNEYMCADKAAHNLTANSPLCQACALRNFRELVYQYRQQIQQEDLPADVTRRPDCYWGKNCRTQKKYHHASKYNHICEQTKFVP